MFQIILLVLCRVCYLQKIATLVYPALDNRRISWYSKSHNNEVKQGKVKEEKVD